MAPREALSGDSLADGRSLLLHWLMPRVKALSGQVPVPGATVQALSLPNFQSIGNPVTTEAQGPNAGKYTLTGLPQGIPVIIIATKDTARGEIRLATYVERVGSQSGVDMDAATTLTTEVLALKIKKTGQSLFSQADWNAARNRIEQEISDLDPEELGRTVIVGQGYIVEHPGGVEGELGENFPEYFLDLIADKPDPDLTDAKIMVQALRDAGYTVKSSIETQLQLYVNSINLEVAPFSTGVTGAVQRVYRPVGAIIDGLEQGEYEELWTGQYKRIGSSSSGSWIIHTYDGLRLEARLKSKNPYLLNVNATSKSPDFRADYRIDITSDAELQPRSFTMVGTLNDDMLRDPVTVDLRGNVTWSQTAEQGIHYPSILTLDGTINSQHVTFTGDMEAEFVYRTEYHDVVPSSATVSGHLESPSVIIDGTLDVEVIFRDDLEQDALPSKLDFSGLLRGRERDYVEFEGRVTARMDNADTFIPDQPIGPSNFIKGDATFSGRVEAFGQAPVILDISLNSREWGKITSNIDYRRGLHTLTGTAETEYTSDPSMPFQYVFEKTTIRLTSEAGVKTELTYTSGAGDAKGTIKSKDGRELATFEVDFGAVVVRYKDGTLDTLF